MRTPRYAAEKTAAKWWKLLDSTFLVVKDAVLYARRYEKQATGHDCGHTFRISIESRLHAGIAGQGPGSHKDADYCGQLVPVEVRAHNLRDALLVAAALPIDAWFPDGEFDD